MSLLLVHVMETWRMEVMMLLVLDLLVSLPNSYLNIVPEWQFTGFPKARFTIGNGWCVMQ